MRATDGRPYELKSVPTKTVAIRTTENCADLVQNFALHLAFPFEGKVSPQVTDEVKFKSVRHRRTPLAISYRLSAICLPRFPRCLRYRVHAITVSAGAPVRF